jgi:hypothetical protein
MCVVDNLIILLGITVLFTLTLFASAGALKAACWLHDRRPS